MGSLGGWEIVIIIGVLVLLFGAKKLPDMARSVGQSARVFKGEMKGMKNDDDARGDKPADAAQTPPPVLPPVTPPAPPVAPTVAPQPESSTPTGTQKRPDAGA